MSSITKYSDNMHPEISGYGLSVVKAVKSTDIIYRSINGTDAMATLVKKELAKTLHILIEQAVVRSGQTKTRTLEANEMKATIQGFVDVIKIHKWMRMGEIKIVFDLGAIGELGDFAGITPKSFHTWCKNYYENVRRPTMKKQLNYESEMRFKAETEKRIKEGKLAFQENRKKIVDYYHVFKLKIGSEAAISASYDQIPAEVDPFNVWYNYFDKRGMIEIDDKRKWEVYDEEVKKLEEKYVYTWNKHRVKDEAKSNAKSRVFRETLLKWIAQDYNIEDFIDDELKEEEK